MYRLSLAGSARPIRRHACATIALLATLAAAAGAMAADPAPPLAPSGKWLVEGQDNMCALSHAFGEGATQVTLAIRPSPLATTDDLLLFAPGADLDVRDGNATVQLDDRERSLPLPYVEYSLVGGKRRLLSFRVAGEALDGLAEAKRITLVFDRKRTVVLAPATAAPALAALHHCEDLLRAQLGIDMAKRERIATPAHPLQPPSLWFSPSDYPEGARMGGAQGASRLLLTIGVDGRVGRCVAFGSSGNAAMDKAACAKFVQRGRYSPALDVGGGPLIAYQEISVRWALGA